MIGKLAFFCSVSEIVFSGLSIFNQPIFDRFREERTDLDKLGGVRKVKEEGNILLCFALLCISCYRRLNFNTKKMVRDREYVVRANRIVTFGSRLVNFVPR